MERGFTADLMFGFFPMIIALVGAGGLYGTFVYRGKKVNPADVPGLPSATAATAGAARLKPSASPAGRLGCAFFIAIFWNGIVSVFLFEMIAGWSKGKGDGCLTVILIPFALVGLGLILLTVYYFLALFNPRPTLRVSEGAAALGDLIDVEWETTGNVDRVKKFTITLEGREEATYRRGTSTTTDKSTFRVIEVVTSSRGKDLRRGKVKLAVPTDTMHTFKSTHNKILWSFHVKGDIPMWPDVGEEFPFEVLPQRLPPGGPS